MDKNWLIRTKTNHILGPISKEKVIELFQNGSIKADDEVCSGNGFWFFIREDDMVKKYLLGKEIQGFNPVSEAKDVLSTDHTKHDVENSQSDITLVNGINVNIMNPIEAPKKGPEDLKKKIVDSKVPLKKQNYFQYVGLIGFIVLFLLLYFRKNIIRSFFNGEMTSHFSLIQEAAAQDDEQLKKKSF